MSCPNLYGLLQHPSLTVVLPSESSVSTYPHLHGTLWLWPYILYIVRYVQYIHKSDNYIYYIYCLSILRRGLVLDPGHMHPTLP